MSVRSLAGCAKLHAHTPVTRFAQRSSQQALSYADNILRLTVTGVCSAREHGADAAHLQALAPCSKRAKTAEEGAADAKDGRWAGPRKARLQGVLWYRLPPLLCRQLVAENEGGDAGTGCAGLSTSSVVQSALRS